MKNKILVLGKGFIGSRIRDEFACDISERNLASFKEAEEEVLKFSPQIIINCIGFTGQSNVDGCETDKDKTLLANSFLPLILAEVALRHNIRLIHISSGCIFNFNYSVDDPINEEKIPDYFELFYSRSKIYSEQALKILANKYPVLIVRLRIPLDDRPHARNILDKLISYKKVIDIPNSVTYIPDFLKALYYLIELEETGVYNLVNKGALKFTELLSVYKKYVPDFEYQVVDFSALNLKRTNLIMSTQKLESLGFKVRNIRDVLEECVKQYLKNK